LRNKISTSFSAWLISVLLFLSSLSKPVHALGVLVYPLTALSLAFKTLAFPWFAMMEVY
jgi:ABC-type uncharacterized transport system permease subunit